MRVLLVLLALVATPFLVSAAQDPHGLNCYNGQGDENRSAQGTAHAHKGVCKPQPPPAPVLDTDLDGVPDNLDQCPGTPAGTTVDASGCAVQPPAPTCQVSQLNLGTGTADGNVYNQSWPNGLDDWCVHLTGVTLTCATISATTLTYTSPVYGKGYFLFTGLPAGTYTICEDMQSGWSGTTCLASFFLGDGWGSSWNNFYNSPQ